MSKQTRAKQTTAPKQEQPPQQAPKVEISDEALAKFMFESGQDRLKLHEADARITMLSQANQTLVEMNGTLAARVQELEKKYEPKGAPSGKRPVVMVGSTDDQASRVRAELARQKRDARNLRPVRNQKQEATS